MVKPVKMNGFVKNDGRYFIVITKADPEKHKKCTQSKFNIFSLHKPFYGFYKGNCRYNEEIYTDLKKITQTRFEGLRAFPGLNKG